MSAGPTQNYDDASLGAWRPRPAAALAVQLLVVLGPACLALAFGLLVARWLPASRTGLPPVAWVLAQVVLTVVVVVGAGRLLRRLTPLGTLLRLSLVFPDRAPSRMAVALRTYSPAALRRRLEALRAEGGLDVEQVRGEDLLGLVGAIATHDQLTRGHSERVQAYTVLIARELGLPESDVAALSWAALLHDLGKLRVPAQILSGSGRPSAAQWRILKGHPEAGMQLAAPLRDWLGPWMAAIGQHHERWDGGGYPLGLAGTQIGLAARIVAVADTFDAITSVRSYKEALSAAAARDEIARCAGTQFDPQVVRAFLAVGLSHLERAAGPLAFLSVVPVLRHLPVPDGWSVPAVASGSFANSMPSVLTAAVVGGALTVASPAFALGDVVGTTGALSTPAVTATPSDEAVPRPTLEPTGQATAWPQQAAAGGAPTAPTPPGAPPPADAASIEVLAGDPAPTSAAPAASAPASPVVAEDGDGDHSSEGAAPARSAASETACERARAGATSMRGVGLAGCDLTGLTLRGDFRAADLSGALLSRAVLQDVNLTGADLTGADLSKAQIERAVLHLATLAGTDLSDSHLTATSLVSADLSGAIFDGTHLTGVVLTGASGTPASAAGAQWKDVLCPRAGGGDDACF